MVVGQDQNEAGGRFEPEFPPEWDDDEDEEEDEEGDAKNNFGSALDFKTIRVCLVV